MPPILQGLGFTKTAQPQISHKGLLDGIKSLLLTPQYSDLTIKTKDGYGHSVHKAIVCPQSSFLASACKAAWQQDHTNAVVELLEDDSPTVQGMIVYFYCSDYDEEEISKRNPPFGPMELNVKMLIAADKYDIPDLATLATAKFCFQVERFSSPKDYLNAVKTIFAEAPDVPGTEKLRQKAVEAAARHAKALLAFKREDADGDSNIVTYKDLVNECPEFGVSVTAELARKCEETGNYQPVAVGEKCPWCGYPFLPQHKQVPNIIRCPNCLMWND